MTKKKTEKNGTAHIIVFLREHTSSAEVGLYKQCDRQIAEVIPKCQPGIEMEFSDDLVLHSFLRLSSTHVYNINLPWATHPCLHVSQVRRQGLDGRKHSQPQLGVVHRIAWKKRRGGVDEIYCSTRRYRSDFVRSSREAGLEPVSTILFFHSNVIPFWTVFQTPILSFIYPWYLCFYCITRNSNQHNLWNYRQLVFELFKCDTPFYSSVVFHTSNHFHVQ